MQLPLKVSLIPCKPQTPTILKIAGGEAQGRGPQSETLVINVSSYYIIG